MLSCFSCGSESTGSTPELPVRGQCIETANISDQESWFKFKRGECVCVCVCVSVCVPGGRCSGSSCSVPARCSALYSGRWTSWCEASRFPATHRPLCRQLRSHRRHFRLMQSSSSSTTYSLCLLTSSCVRLGLAPCRDQLPAVSSRIEALGAISSSREENKNMIKTAPKSKMNDE